MLKNWSTKKIQEIFSKGLWDLFPGNCNILKQTFFLDIAVSKEQTDKSYGHMTELEKVILTLGGLSLMAGFQKPGLGPLPVSGDREDDRFYLVDPKVYKDSAKLSAAKNLFSSLLASSFSRLVTEKGVSIPFSVREGFEIIFETPGADELIELPMRKVFIETDLEKVLIKQLFDGLDLKKLTSTKLNMLPLPKTATCLGKFNDFELLTFSLHGALMEEIYKTRAEVKGDKFPADKLKKIQRKALISGFFNLLFARSVFNRFPDLQEEELVIGKGFKIGQDPELPECGMELVEVQITPEMLEKMGMMPGMQIPITQEEEFLTGPVSEDFNLNDWDPKKANS